VECESQHGELIKIKREMFFTMAIIMGEVVTLIFERIETLILDWSALQ